MRERVRHPTLESILISSIIFHSDHKHQKIQKYYWLMIISDVLKLKMQMKEIDLLGNAVHGHWIRAKRSQDEESESEQK